MKTQLCVVSASNRDTRFYAGREVGFFRTLP